jgi:undecaprenyl-diphosphatase
VSVALFSITYFLINKNIRLSKFWKNIYFTFTVFFIFLVSISRLVLGVHYLSDVVVGVCLGYLGYMLGTIVYKKIK